ncbi:platelet glycoprotein Ib alpha chain [Mantella aurantiaca]
MVAARPSFYFGIIALLFANKTAYSCVTEENLSKGMKETSCISLNLTSVPLKDIPQDTGILILSYNNLKAVSTSTFKEMKQLLELDLADNVLTSFKVDLPLMLQELNLANNSFKSIPDLSQLSSLTRLVLSNNQISSIPDSAFIRLKNLKVLELQRNVIDSLSGEVFNGLGSLDHLDLSHNNLWELPTHLISSLVRLEKFYLTENKLTDIPEDFFVGLDSLAYVYLDKNPWICNCALLYFKQWVEENGHNLYYLSDGSPVNEEKSVLCSDGTPLIEYNMDACVGNGHGDVDQHIIPTPTKYRPAIKVTRAQPTTEPWMTTTITTIPVLTTEEHPTSVATTTKRRRLTTAIVTSTKQPETTTMAWTTKKRTTTFKSTMMTTTEQRTTTQTTAVPTSTIHSKTTWHPTSTATTTTQTTEVPTSTVYLTTTRHPTSTMVGVEPNTLATTSVTTTQLVTVTNGPTSVTVTEPSLMSTEFQEFKPWAPAEKSRVEAHGMSWLEYQILKNCCFLHLILYVSGLLLLLAQMVISACLLVWTHTHLYRHYRALVEKLPNIRLIRYSLRTPANEGEILLVHDKAMASIFSDHSSSGVTRMVVLEANTKYHEKIYTSAIL